MNFKKLVAAESITSGHPDYLSDSISDAILQAYYEQDKEAHTGIETLVTENFVCVAGEVKSTATVDVEKVIRNTIEVLGYTDPALGFSFDTVEIINKIHAQSPDIDMGVSRENPEDEGQGDQGFMTGYASNETKELMPLPITLAKALTKKLTEVREEGITQYLYPDGKSQVVFDYGNDDTRTPDEDRPVLKTVLISCHHKDVDMSLVRSEIIDKVILPVLGEFHYTLDGVEVLINPTGKFSIGGPKGDTGLTGRKLVVENYGPSAPIGGGACFVEGTLVHTVDGLRPIESIKVGDSVISYNEATGTQEANIVLENYVRDLNADESLYVVELDSGEKFIVTGNHPFFIKDKGWVKVEDLKADSEVYLIK